MNTQLAQSISVLQNIISNGGPETTEYETLQNAVDAISEEYKSGKISNETIELLKSGFSEECLKTTLHGHALTKPFGYAGDFLIIDKLYREQVTEDMRFQKWDIFWHNLAAAKAVRNRKDYFIKTMVDRLNCNENLSLLNVASGPARDLAELYKTLPWESDLQTVCVEADNYAINYARKLNQPNENCITFIHKNIFGFSTEVKFDIVWSAGLFDYFDDKTFVRLIKKFMGFTKPGGEIIIGNFGLENPSRSCMELVGDWYLQHRSTERLIEMAVEAGIQQGNIYVGSEQEGVNLFLHLIV